MKHDDLLRVVWCVWLGVCVLVVNAPAVFGQGLPTGSLTGNVTAAGEPLPGVTVTAASPRLQGVRTTSTSSNGDYILPSLPPGEYTVTYELHGFAPATSEARVAAAQTSRVNVTMAQAGVAEEIVVTGGLAEISGRGQASTTIDATTAERLPVGRAMLDAVGLVSGVHTTGPNDSVTIAGSHSFENLFLVNGVVVNENIRGQPFNLFIEDAILETTTSVSGVSAEYGRFSGGVVNTITKSGGNELSGSIRTSFNNEDWEARPPGKAEKLNDLVTTWEATLGGPILQDRLWYFGAGRLENVTTSKQTLGTNLPYELGEDELRWEGKLTLAATPSHSIVGTYQNETRDQSNNEFTAFPSMDMASLDDRKLPSEFWNVNYSGILSGNVFIELQAARRSFAFEESGGTDRDLIAGTIFTDPTRPGMYHAPIFCGACPDEERNMENYLAKGNWFVSTERAGSHNLVVGVDSYNDIRKSDNFQSASNFRIQPTHPTEIRGDQLFPIMDPALAQTFIVWFPILESSRGTDLWSHAVYVNDEWQVGDRLGLNLGLRFDRNDGRDASGASVTKDDELSPRLGVSYDLFGDGNWVLNASAGRYVAAVANTQADATSIAGTPATVLWLYDGPAINPDPNAPTAELLSPGEALEVLFTHFCGTLSREECEIFAGTFEGALQVTIPGVTSGIRGGSLRSPSAEEISVGLTTRRGGRGMVRADVVHREYKNFYATVRNLDTIAQGEGDFFLIANSNDPERVYTGLHTQASYRITDRLQTGLSWALSHARGNFDGETVGGGPGRFTSTTDRPEYEDPSWSNPRRNLGVDQRHRARVWAMYDVMSSPRFGTLNLSLLQGFNSGRTYSAVGVVDTREYVPNPGYQSPPAGVNYYFATDAFRTDDATSTDVSLNYSFFAKLGTRTVEVLVQPQVTNLFNEQAVTNVNTAVNTAANSNLEAFNPFEETPVQGVHWELGSSFGQPQAPTDYQAPRTFRVSVGVRF